MMLPIILIIIGGILFLYGVILIIRMFFAPLTKAFEVFFEREDDYIHYEYGRGKGLREEARRTLVTLAIFCIVLGTILMGIGFYLKYGPRGEGALALTESQAGGSSNPQAQGMTSSGSYISEDGTEYTYFIKITGNTITFGDAFSGNADEFEEFISTVDRGTSILIIDDFASAGSYYRVQDLLDEYGMTYEEEESR